MDVSASPSSRSRRARRVGSACWIAPPVRIVDVDGERAALAEGDGRGAGEGGPDRRPPCEFDLRGRRRLAPHELDEDTGQDALDGDHDRLEVYHCVVRPLVLASSSPRRAELLQAAGLPFVVRSGSVDETRHTDETPDAYVRRLALAKACAAAAAPHELVLGADTVVVAGAASGSSVWASPATPKTPRRCCASSPAARTTSDRRRAGPGGRAGRGGRGGHPCHLCADERWTVAWYVATAGACTTRGRLRRPGPGVALRDRDRGLLLERRRLARRACLPPDCGRRGESPRETVSPGPKSYGPSLPLAPFGAIMAG